MTMGATRLVTRCPACRTAFRVVADQLRLRQGLVRCGQCDTVFDARDHLIEVPVTPADGGKVVAAPASPAAAPDAPARASDSPPAQAPVGPPSPVVSADGDEDGEDGEEAERRLPVWSRELEAGYDVPALDAPTVMMFDDADTPVVPPDPAAERHHRDHRDQREDGGDAVAAPADTGEAAPAERADSGIDGRGDERGDEPVATFVPGVIDTADDTDDDTGDTAAEAGQTAHGNDARGTGLADTATTGDDSARPKPAAPAATRSASGYLRAPAQDTVLDAGGMEPAVSATAAAVAREQTTRKWVRPDDQPDPLPTSGRFSPARFSPNFLRHRNAREARPGARRWGRIAVRVAVVLLMLAAVLQAAYLARSQLAGRFPALRPMLEAACAPMGCEVPPWRDIDALRIESSQLQKQDEDGDEYQLSVALRNHGAATVALPAIELVLTDLQDQLLLRRVLQPGEYLAPGERALARQGLAANTELPVRVRFRTPHSAANYRVLIFYP
jgi:predicted Zn finger-like uncharacterized protein